MSMSTKSEETLNDMHSSQTKTNEQQSEITFSDYDKLLINHIISSRKRACEKITSLLKKYHQEQKNKKNLIAQKIIEERRKAVNILIEKFKKLKYKFQIKKILKLKEKCYTIISSITDSNLSLKVYLGNGKEKIYKFQYCPIQDANVLYLPRSDIIGLIIKVHFLNEKGVVIVDPKFSTDFEDNQFYNVINFRKIMKAEKDEKEENQKLIKLLCMKKAGSDVLKNSTSTDSLASLPHKGLSKYNKKFFSMANLNINLKSILKPRPAKRVSSKRKISFGDVQFSY